MAENQKNWLEQLILAKKAYTSNVYLLETIDPRRYETFVEWAQEKINDKDAQAQLGFSRIIEMNLQTADLYDVTTSKQPAKVPLPAGVGRPVKYMDSLLREEGILLLVKWITDEKMGAEIAGFLTEWSNGSITFAGSALAFHTLAGTPFTVTYTVNAMAMNTNQ